MSTSSNTPPRVAVVTGAAQGIGKAAADRLFADGYAVVGGDIHGTSDHTAKWDLRSCDVADEDQVKALIGHVTERLGRLDVLVNVAGIVIVKPLVETGWDEFQHMLSVNLGGTFLTCKHAVPALAESGSGVIVNVGSVSGHVGQIDHSLYGASKGAVIALGRALAWELAPQNIRVATVSPGSVDTAMLRSDINLEAERTGKSFAEVKTLREGEQALGRWADPAEIAAAISFLASPEASFITGADLLVDCGWVAR
jgi:NAD(P)-dependent dehydrogenase (short-subunit alcohol dehydrogenase family)